MRFVGLKRASFESWVTGAVLAVLHLAVVLMVLWFTAGGSHDAQWQLAFVPLFIIDLPVAILAYPVGIGAAWIARGVGVSPAPALVVAAVANGLIGSLFYLVLPPAISAHRRFRREAA